ncbi:hypothetical protein SAMN02910447_02407 [Ruminococcus sp. YE71]|uniref:hypothetical protein n=1 Tax=unclassified Ruminococcus TaxID=2608920 RepID=UPI0008909588|nr:MULTISPECIES: hypothetical protein [unclassified Ruminococcus]SDA23953.1 hypothetical protein SAMN02910446_02274 [Ruminococcus sp. YE78]SFW40763.1 hypothetical protein SAMN02910447_02407 [Ruminococcus sp. YE71]
MTTNFKPKKGAPYSLHDARVSRIEIVESGIRLSFENGLTSVLEPYPRVNGTVTYEHPDPDFCVVYILSRNGETGKFGGEKMMLTDFIGRYWKFTFEIVDETFGYDTVSLGGFLDLPDTDGFLEMNICICHSGSIVYETDE